MGGRWWRKLAQAGAALLTGLSWIGLAGAEVVTANDAVLEAARRNPAIEAAVHDVAAARHGFDAADRERTPRYFASAQGEYAEAHTGAASGVALTDRRSISGATGVRYTTPVGTDLEIGVEAGASWRSSTITAATTDKVTIGPNYSGRLYATIRQPLLQGAGTDAVLAPVVQAETARTIAERQRDQAASQVIADVLSAYWELWYAQHAVEVQRAALAVAERQHAETELKIETLGTAARVELLQYATSRATIQEALNTALRTRATRAVELGRLMGLAPPEARRLVAAAEPPEAVALPPTELLYRAAHEQALGLRTLEAQVDLARQRVEAASDQDQPRLDAFATLGMSGLWANDDLPGLTLPGNRPAFSGLVGLELELPMGAAAVTARLAQARSELEAAEARLAAEEAAVEANVESLAIELDAAAQQVELTQQTAALAAELAAAESAKVSLGSGTPAEVVRAQQSQRESALRQLRASVDQASAQIRLELQIGGLLPRFADVLAASPGWSDPEGAR